MKELNVHSIVNGHHILYGCENANYNILEQAQCNEYEYIVLAYNQVADSYVTWQYNQTSNSYNWGHYIKDCRKAYIDYYERVQEYIQLTLSRLRAPF